MTNPLSRQLFESFKHFRRFKSRKILKVQSKTCLVKRHHKQPDLIMKFPISLADIRIRRSKYIHLQSLKLQHEDSITFRVVIGTLLEDRHHAGARFLVNCNIHSQAMNVTDALIQTFKRGTLQDDKSKIKYHL